MPPSVIPMTVYPGSRPQFADAMTPISETVPARCRPPLAVVVVEPLEAVQRIVAVPRRVRDRSRETAVVEVPHVVERVDEALPRHRSVADALDGLDENFGGDPLVRGVGVERAVLAGVVRVHGVEVLRDRRRVRVVE